MRPAIAAGTMPNVSLRTRLDRVGRLAANASSPPPPPAAAPTSSPPPPRCTCPPPAAASPASPGNASTTPPGRTATSTSRRPAAGPARRPAHRARLASPRPSGNASPPPSPSATRPQLPGGGKVRIAGRRPATGGDVRWTFVFDARPRPVRPGPAGPGRAGPRGPAPPDRPLTRDTPAATPPPAPACDAPATCCGIRSRICPAFRAAPANSSPFARSLPAASCTFGFSDTCCDSLLICSYRSRPAFVPRT